jgi:hypothetical protein
MRRIPVILLAVTGFASITLASPVCTGTVQNAMDNFKTLATACAVGDKLFYNFTYSGTGGPLNPPASIPSATEVNMAGDNSNPSEPGLIFSSAKWTVSGTPSTQDNFIDSNITFSVATFGLVPLIEDASLDYNNQFTVTGVGRAFIGETVTLPGGAGTVGLGVDSNAGPFTDVKNFAPVATLSVSKDLQVRIPKSLTGGPFSTATITSFREGFSEIPEPVSTTLIGSGLLGLAFLKRRR